MNAYVLVPRQGGAKLKAVNEEVGDVRTSRGAARLRVSGKVTMPYFAGLLSNMLDQPVADMTELKGVYDIDLEWAADNANDGAPSLMTVLQDQLGLRLETRKTAVDVFVIDHLNRVPSAN